MKLTLNGSAIKKVHQDNSIDLLCNEEQLYECLDNVRIGLIAKYLFMRLNNPSHPYLRTISKLSNIWSRLRKRNSS